MTNPVQAKRAATPGKRLVPRARTGSKRGLRLTNYAEVFQAAPAERIKAIKSGVQARYVVTIAKSMGSSKEGLLRALGLSRATVDRKITRSVALSPDEGQRVLGMASLVGLVETMAKQSGDPKDFDAAKWLAKWINEPSPAFGGRKPAEFLDTAEGQQLVATTLQRMQSGAYG
jgi:putative toxin-antitoxin system antitoxin component (TIGR02293 family)